MDYRRLGDLNNKNLFSVLEAASLEIRKAVRGGFWCELASWLADGCLLSVSSRGLVGVGEQAPDIRALILSWVLHLPDLI